MKILVINGSPKEEHSNTYRLTKAFLAGMQESDGAAQTRELIVGRLDIRPCLGCFSCWNRTPGQCCLTDDMREVIEDLLWADVTIWSFPLYYFSVPGALKNLIDRQLPMVLPFMSEDGGETGSGSHPARYDMSGKRTVVISTCGFYTAEGNYDGVLSLFDHICGKGQYTTLFCGQGELFRVPEVRQRTDEYLEQVRQAGREYQSGGISGETRARLDRLLFPRQVFERMADASWGLEKETGARESDTLIFTRQMAALYRKQSWPGHDLVLEMNYTDVKERYQIVLGQEGSTVLTAGFRAADTTVETPVQVWRAIAAGEISGSEALMRHQYRVKGDLGFLMDWDTYFAGAQSTSVSQEEEKESAGISAPSKPAGFSILLTPWIVFWVGASIHPLGGGAVSLAACALVPLIFYRNRKTVYDVLSGGLVTCFSAALLLGAPVRLTLPLSYLSFGVMWTVSCFGRIPLTAYYSLNDYGGESALSNVLFIRTNRILTLAWGVLYLLTPIWTYFILGTGIGGWIGAVNSILPLLMGGFTVWFQKWYPAKVARG